jgi:hypothetical protein
MVGHRKGVRVPLAIINAYGTSLGLRRGNERRKMLITRGRSTGSCSITSRAAAAPFVNPLPACLKIGRAPTVTARTPVKWRLLYSAAQAAGAAPRATPLRSKRLNGACDGAGRNRRDRRRAEPARPARG